MTVCDQCKKKLKAGRSVLVLSIYRDYTFCSRQCFDAWCFAHKGRIISYTKTYMVSQTTVEASHEDE